jgi:hypothetical protein
MANSEDSRATDYNIKASDSNVFAGDNMVVNQLGEPARIVVVGNNIMFNQVVQRKGNTF